MTSSKNCQQPRVAHQQITSSGDQNYPSFELRIIFAYLKNKGHGQWCQQQLKALGLSERRLQLPFIPSYIALDGLNRIVNTFYKPGLGCDIAQTYRLSELGAIGAYIGSASTLGEAMEISQSYHQVLGSFTDIVNIVDEHNFTNRLLDVTKLNPAMLQFLFELTFSSMIKLAEEMSQTTVSIKTIRFSASLNKEIKKFFSKRYRCTIEDNCKFNEWVIDMSSLALPVTHDLYSPNELTSNLKSLLNELNKEQGLVDDIDQILKCSVGDFPDPEMISSALGMSGRTMRRRLNKMGINFSTLIDKVRCQLAINLIQQRNLSNEDLAGELGYSDAANFYNAFKKWTNHSPTFYRINTSNKNKSAQLNTERESIT